MKTFIIFLSLFFLTGCSTISVKKDLVFVPHELPVYYTGQQLNMVCPVCGVCLPDGGNYCSVTLLGCLHGCCNTATYTYRCQTKDSTFQVSINECDWIVWGVEK